MVGRRALMLVGAIGCGTTAPVGDGDTSGTPTATGAGETSSGETETTGGTGEPPDPPVIDYEEWERGCFNTPLEDLYYPGFRVCTVRTGGESGSEWNPEHPWYTPWSACAVPTECDLIETVSFNSGSVSDETWSCVLGALQGAEPAVLRFARLGSLENGYFTLFDIALLVTGDGGVVVDMEIDIGAAVSDPIVFKSDRFALRPTAEWLDPACLTTPADSEAAFVCMFGAVLEAPVRPPFIFWGEPQAGASCP